MLKVADWRCGGQGHPWHHRSFAGTIHMVFWNIWVFSSILEWDISISVWVAICVGIQSGTFLIYDCSSWILWWMTGHVTLFYVVQCTFQDECHLFCSTRTSARYAHLILAPAGRGWGTVQTLLQANKYSCILIHTISYPYIPIITHNRSCYSSIWCCKFATFG